MRLVSGLLALAAVALPAGASAADRMVAASRPDGLAAALRGGGYEVTPGTDDTGDPVLDLVMQGYKARVLFLDCDGAHANCGSVQFTASFDAEGAGMSPADAVGFAARYRYAAVTVSAAGDPTLRWDVETGAGGIPAEVFVDAAARFLGTVRAMGERLFPRPPG